MGISLGKIHHSCSDVSSTRLAEMEKSNEVAAVFFDLTKAFDYVPHKHLINKLETIGLDIHLIKWITNYLTNQYQSVVLNG